MTSIAINTIDIMANLKSVYISNNVTYIGIYSICYNPILTTLVIGNSVKIIHDYAFKGNDLLKTITFNKGIKIIFNEECFYKENNLLMIVDVYYSDEDYKSGFLDNYINYPVNYINL